MSNGYKFNGLDEKDFDDDRKNVKFFSVLEIVIIAILLIVIIAMVSIFLLFSKDGATPKVFGYNIFLSRTSTIKDVDKNSAIFARDDMLNDLKSGNVVLCQIGEEKITTMLRIQEVIVENDKKYYILRPDTNPDNATIKLPHENIIAQAVKFDKTLGNILNFARSKPGIITIIIIPFIIFFALQIIHIIKVGKINKYDDDVDEEDDDVDDVIFSTQSKPELEQKISHKTEKYLKTNASVYQEPEPEDEELYYTPKKNIYVNESGKAEYQKKPSPTATVDDFRRQTLNKPTTDSSRIKSNDSETSSEIYFKAQSSTYSSNAESGIYKKTVREEPRLDPPNITNPSDITIPNKAVQPNVTIAPPPKSSNNKTLEELMQMIDKNIK